MVKPIEIIQDGIIVEQRLIKPKDLKRALVGWSWKSREISTLEASCLLVRKKIAENISEARRFLDSIEGELIDYSSNGRFILSRTQEGYRMNMYCIEEWF